MYAPNIELPKYIKQVLTDIKGEIDNNTIIVGNFHTPFTSVDIAYRQKINMETVALNNTVDHIDLIDIFRTSHPQTAECMIFSIVDGTFSRINHMWGAWVAQSVWLLTSAQVMISQLVGSNPTSGSVLTAWSLGSASDSVSPSLSLALPSHALCLSLSKNK